jgi:hypothetical protein
MEEKFSDTKSGKLSPKSGSAKCNFACIIAPRRRNQTVWRPRPKRNENRPARAVFVRIPPSKSTVDGEEAGRHLPATVPE